MTDDDFETTDPMKIDQALQQIIQGLHQAADGYETLRDILPTVPVTNVAGIVQIAPTLPPAHEQGCYTSLTDPW